MKYLLILVIAGLMIMVVVSLVRGIVAFMQSTRDDLKHDYDDGPSPMQLRQNKMMFNRILFQAAAVLVVAVLLAIGSK
ncbi:MAG: twin transmembrane helix small protein [Novosphingobium sp.]